MPVIRFTALTALGSTVWNSALIGAGWGLGSNYEKVGNVIGPIGTLIVGVCAVGVAVLIAWAFKRRRSISS